MTPSPDPTILDRASKLNVWSRGSERAPHKPLLLLLALGRYSRHLNEPAPFEEIAPELESLLIEFGPSRKSHHPEYPFWRLQNDGLWVVESDSLMQPRKSNSDPSKRELVSKNATGQLHPDVIAALASDPNLLKRLAREVLEAHFPSTIHEDILSAVGLDLSAQWEQRRSRDPKFRALVLLAYEYRCAVCDMDIRLHNLSIGIEAAHIKWHQAGGPDAASNGLALCSTHHKIFDLGGFTVDPEDGLLVSECATGSVEFSHVLLRHHGRPIRSPQHPEQRPAPGHLAWHRRQVFKEAPRHISRGE